MLKRRLFLLLAVLLPLLGFAQAKSVPYFSQIGGTSKLDADWTVYNVNGDEKTWINDATVINYSSISAVKVTAGAKYVFNTKADANDWLVSPAIHLEADKEYKVSFYVKTSGFIKRVCDWLWQTPTQPMRWLPRAKHFSISQNSQKRLSLRKA